MMAVTPGNARTIEQRAADVLRAARDAFFVEHDERAPQHLWRQGAILAFLTGLFVFRICYGLSLELRSGDGLQVYLLGLKFFTTGAWPFFGPDVAYGAATKLTTHQIAGPVQGLLVGLPLYLFREPEAPLVLLNVLSFAGLVVFGRYLTHRFPLVPAWLTYAWLLTCPWTLNFSTHVYNPSYLLLPSCLFFVGFLELWLPGARTLVSPGASFFAMGLSFATALQLHLSWLLLLPFLGLVVVARMRQRLLVPGHLGWLLAGAAVPLALLVPTMTRYGWAVVFEPIGSNVDVNRYNAAAVVTITARFLSFASFEIPRFLGQDLQARLATLRQDPWLIPLALGVGIVGAVQPFVILAVLFRPGLLRVEGDPCSAVRWLVVITLTLLCVVFLFTSASPISRDYYILCPVALLAGYLAFGSLIQTRRARRWAIAMLAAGAILQGGLAARQLQVDPWTVRRARVMRTIQEGDYRILAERRPHVRF